MNNSKSCAIDPDYEMTEIAREHIRYKEDRENRGKIEKAKEIIKREFKRELDYRQSQLELIEQRINRAQKTLHLLRYILISSYYNNQELLLNETEESTASNIDHQISDKSRIHPALKKLLGSDNTLNFYRNPRKKRKHSDKNQEEIVKQEELQDVKTFDLSNSLIVTDNQLDAPVNKVNAKNPKQQLNNVNNTVNEECVTGRNRKKFKYVLVVGNISKWMPSESKEDNSTHKWMVYVRGPKDNPDVTHFIQKVVFYLHPSYKPNDVVELKDGPYHLARRGWGEFPLRIKIFFRCSLNKPVDIIHHLKLDKTFTGRQTLGNETVVNLFLYNNENVLQSKSKELNTSEQISTCPVAIKEEPVDIEDNYTIQAKIVTSLENDRTINAENHNFASTSTFPNLEHDYCFSRVKQEEDNFLQSSLKTNNAHSHIQMDHSYCINNETNKVNDYSTVNVCELQPTDLSFGITEDTEKDEIIEEMVVEEKPIIKKNSAKYNLQKVMLGNGTVITIKRCRKPQQSLLRKMFRKNIEKKLNDEGNAVVLNTNESAVKIKREPFDNNVIVNYNKYRVHFPSHKFKNVTEALPYLFKRLPLINELASDFDYKCTYPYTAKSLDEYSKWNVGRRLSSEWYRAKHVLKLINSVQLPNCKKWTTKSLIMYARSHGYTPLADYTIFKSKKNSMEAAMNGISGTEHDKCVIKPLQEQISKFDDVVDVVDCSPEPKQSKNDSIHKTKLIDPSLQYACSYVKQTVLDGGIVLKSEEITPGVLYNGAERILLQAVFCLAEDLIRKARANLVLKGNFHEETSTVGSDEIEKALQERPEFMLLLKSNRSDDL